MSLTTREKRVIYDVRVLAGLKDEAALTARSGMADPGMARAFVLGELQHVARELAAIAERLGGEDQAAGDTRRLDAIRGVLNRFDWEHDDRQYALERIEAIAEGGLA